MITHPEIESYCIAHSKEQEAIFSELSARTEAFAPHVSHMQVGPLEGQFLRMLVQMSGAKRILEFGTFTGCSSLHFLMALPADGKITTLDRDPKAVAIAQEFWEKTGNASRVESLVQDAKVSLDLLWNETESGSRPHYDLAFIDADKGGYEAYFEACLKLVRPHGYIIVDNLLWAGAVLKPEDKSDFVIHQFNERRKSDPRVDALLLPIRDGIAVYRVLPQ